MGKWEGRKVGREAGTTERTNGGDGDGGSDGDDGGGCGVAVGAAGRPCGRSRPPPSPCVCSCSCVCHHMLKCCVLHAMASPALACSGVLSPRGCVHASVLLRCRIHVHCGRVERAHTFSAEQISRSCSSVSELTACPCVLRRVESLERVEDGVDRRDGCLRSFCEPRVSRACCMAWETPVARLNFSSGRSSWCAPG